MNKALRKKHHAQIFSFDIMLALFVLISVLVSALWLWDTAREKIYLAESRNNLELLARNAMYSLLQTVGDPPTWHLLPVINETTVMALGIGKNRPWFLDTNKTLTLNNLNATHYTIFKKILTIRGNEFFLNISKFNQTTKQFTSLAKVGKYPQKNAEQVVRIHRFALDENKQWISIALLVWKPCVGSYC